MRTTAVFISVAALSIRGLAKVTCNAKHGARDVDREIGNRPVHSHRQRQMIRVWTKGELYIKDLYANNAKWAALRHLE
jgi:hypothetical protein